MKHVFMMVFSLINLTQVLSQTNGENSKYPPQQYYSIQAGLTLLEAPIVFYPNIGLSYSKTFYGNRDHQLAFNPQFQFITLPSIEHKYLLSGNLEYKFQPKWRFEVNVFAGINYQLRKNLYDRYEYKNNQLENVGKIRHQIGPTLGLQLGYKIFRRTNFSISPNLGFSLTKLRKSYINKWNEGFVPTLSFGIKLNIN
jgi:hypothetical protein